MPFLTTDLSKFGSRELAMAADLLKALSESDLIHDADIKLYFNMNSGFVFLGNENGDCWLMNGDTLETWYFCPICGHEGFLEDMEHGEEKSECKEYCQDIGAI